MGGAMASFAALGDVLLAEPRALLGFAGPTVIKQTIRKDLPEGFQTSEMLLKCGLIDRIVDRTDLRETLARLLDYAEGPEVSGAASRQARSDQVESLPLS